MDLETDYVAIATRNARSVQTLIGWIFWDPGAVARYEALGLPGPLGYIAARVAPFAGAGPDAAVAAFGSISPLGIGIVFSTLRETKEFEAFWRARNDAVLEGLERYAPAAAEGLARHHQELWRVVESLPLVARALFASHLTLERPDHPVLSGWHAVNCLREWRGDTHWAIVASHGLNADEASILHNAWLGYDGDWLSQSRGNTPESIDRAWSTLVTKGLAKDRRVSHEGLVLRQLIEDETDAACASMWQLYGRERSIDFADTFEGPCELLLERVNVTAGERYQPASRIRERYNG